MAKQPEQTRAALIKAALETLRSEGFRGTTARAIAGRAGVNQALVYYHFGGVDRLLLTALDATSAERLDAYRTAMAAAGNAEERVAAARRLYQEDVESGHATAISELLAASLARPELRDALLERMNPWLALAEDVLRDVAGGTPLGELVPLHDVASALVALYLGLNLLSRLDPANAQAESLFELMERVVPLMPPPSTS